MIVLSRFHTVGCKIKALRAKTNTYIKTPLRGEEPIFIITGRPEDVSVAKKEILQAADHFSQIRAARRSSSQSSPNVGSTAQSGSEEKITIFVRVPYRVVGLVVGPKGATVKRIQQSTGTYIVTPSRDMEPFFEVRGTPENVERAKKEIESYIVQRTGGSFDQLGSPAGNGNGLLHCTESPSPTPSEGSVPLTTRRAVRRAMSMSEASSLYPGSVLPVTPTISEADSGRSERRSSPLSSAVFYSGSNCGLEDDVYHHSVPMSAPAYAFSKVFDFGGDKLKQVSNNWNGSWNPQTAWGSSHLYPKAATAQPPSPTGSWGSSGGKLSPQPPSPTESWGSNSSEGNAVMSPRPFPPSNGFTSPQGHSQFSRLGWMQQQLRKTNPSSSSAFAGVLLCCCCEQSEADTIMIPCGHKTTCFNCACKIAAVCPVCPGCNAKIESLAQQLCS